MSGIPDCPDCGASMICYKPRLEYRCVDCNSYYIRAWSTMLNEARKEGMSSEPYRPLEESVND